ncbi:MAG: hypothetical protein HYY03_07350, partial [Chloroflexi bacterium]|nr:hypothetical protein [Chloroflexota bacterium]
DHQLNHEDADDDNDQYDDGDEALIGTDPNAACGADWPANLNNAGGSANKIDIFDVNKLAPPVFFSSVAGAAYQARLDLKPDGVINIFDVNKLAPPVFFSTCLP